MSEIDTVEDYLAILPEERREVLQKIRVVIRENLPGSFEEKIQYKMISYVVPKECYPQGYHCNPEDELSFMTIGWQKHHLAIYSNAIYLFDDVREWFLSEYPNYMISKPDIGKSCIRFKNIKKIPFELIARLCRRVTMEDFIKRYENR